MLGQASDSHIIQTHLNVFDNTKTVTEETVELMEPWTKAMAIFYWINKEVMPLKANLVLQENKLGKAQDKLHVAQAQLDEKEEELLTVQVVYDKAMKEKQELLEDAETCKRKMNAATSLISQRQIKQLVGTLSCLQGYSPTRVFQSGVQEQTARHLETRTNSQTHTFSKNLDLISMLTDQTPSPSGTCKDYQTTNCPCRTE